MIDTRKTDRRTLAYGSFDELAADLDRIASAHERGALRTTGNWTAGEVCDHCANFMRCALDGFPGGVPWYLRIAGVLLKPAMLRGTSQPAGMKIPKSAVHLRPREGVSVEEGHGALRREVERVRGGAERMEHPSPLLGRMTHEQWVTLQLSHCALHLSFLHVDDA